MQVPSVAPQVVEPTRRADGLVESRPGGPGVDYDDPMWENYRWVAMLDPVELSRGVEISEVQAHRRLGRETWTATCRALPGEEVGYDPRCSCCPLLYGEVSQSLEFNDPSEVDRRRPPRGYPTAHRVSLDVETGIVVEVLPCDGDDSNSAFSNDICAVGLLG